ncbi:MAG: site-specific DNA-methyltransferase [Flavobacterium sp.]
MNKQDLIAKIKQLDGVTQDERAYLINLVNTKKKYGLVWEDKPEAVEEQLRENLPVLKEVKEKAIINEDVTLSESSRAESRGEVPNHILIEGDNLHALTALTFTHEGKIDVIYIDPPYNTGNNDFWYNDNYINRDDGYRHSKWLSYMDKRLRIAKKLLKEEGLIFISIDDNEQSQLKLLCDEIFYEKNFIGNICQKSRHSISNDLIISQNHNFLLVYSKNFQNIFQRKNDFRLTKEVDVSKFKNPDNDPRGPYKINPVDGPGGARKGNPYYEFLDVTGYYRYSKETMQELYDNGEIVKRKSTLGRKYFLSKALENNQEAVTTWWDDVGTTTEGTKLLKEIIPNCDFTNPKPINLLDRILQLSTKKSSGTSILDFFAGSGTTLHATMALNAEDGGNRQCILVTNNENNICEEVTYERNKRVIQGYTNAKGVAVEGLKNNNLRYYKSEFVPSNKSDSNNRLLTNLSTDLLCIKEDCYTDITQTEGFNPSDCRIFSNNQGKFLIVVYYSRNLGNVCDTLKTHVKSMVTTQKIKLYGFSPETETLVSDFLDVSDLVDAVPLPEAIYNAYRATFRTLKLDKKRVAIVTPTDEAAGETTLFDEAATLED